MRTRRVRLQSEWNCAQSSWRTTLRERAKILVFSEHCSHCSHCSPMKSCPETKRRTCSSPVCRSKRQKILFDYNQKSNSTWKGSKSLKYMPRTTWELLDSVDQRASWEIRGHHNAASHPKKNDKNDVLNLAQTMPGNSWDLNPQENVLSMPDKLKNNETSAPERATEASSWEFRRTNKNCSPYSECAAIS